MRYILMALLFTWCSHILPMEVSKKNIRIQAGTDPIQFLLEWDPKNTQHPDRSVEYCYGRFPPVSKNDLKNAAWRKHNLLVFIGEKDHSGDCVITQAFRSGEYLSGITKYMVSRMNLLDLIHLNNAHVKCSEVLQDVEKYMPDETISNEYNKLDNILEKHDSICALIKDTIAKKEAAGTVHICAPRDPAKYAHYTLLNSIGKKLKPGEDQVIYIEVRTSDTGEYGISPLLQNLVKKMA